MIERPRFPREHGFWVMLGAVAITSLVRAGFDPFALLAAGITLPLVILGAGTFGRRVRKSRRYQLISAMALPLAGVPVELAGGVGLVSVIATTLAWAAVFLASALVVRAAFERSRPTGDPKKLERLAIAIVFAGGLEFAAAGFVHHALALGLGLVVFLYLVSRHPTAKQLRPLGLGLAGVAAVAAVVLGSSG